MLGIDAGLLLAGRVEGVGIRLARKGVEAGGMCFSSESSCFGGQSFGGVWSRQGPPFAVEWGGPHDQSECCFLFQLV
jgi:hypothetical protein